MDKFLVKTDPDPEDDKYSEISSISNDEDSHDDSADIVSNATIKDAVDPITFFNSKELCFYKTIDKFYKKCGDKEIIRMLNIINGESEISLRVLDWFVTRYSKRKIDFNDDDDNTLDAFDVHISYKSELKSYKKKYFDPFRRRKKFYYPFYLNEKHFDSNNSQASKEVILLYTTLGQLNFFRWAISNKIIHYVFKNLDNIIIAMNTSNKDDKKKKQKIQYIKKKDTKIKSIDKKNNNCINNYFDDNEDENQLILNFD